MTTPASHDRASQSRRTHRKSRLGCGNCKRRKIKCDETRPTCENCFRHTIACDYHVYTPQTRSTHRDGQSSASDASNASNRPLGPPLKFISASQSNYSTPKRKYVVRSALARTQGPCNAVGFKPFEFSAIDMALFHHLMSSTELGSSYPSLQTQFTRLGFSFHYLLHLLLAFSSFHASRSQEATLRINRIVGYDVDYHAEGERHYSIAVSAVAEEVPRLGKENGLALFASSVFVFICSIARGPQAGEYLAFRSDGQPGSVSLFIGVRSILETCIAKLSIDASVLYHDEPSEASPLSTQTYPQVSSPRNPKVRHEYAPELRRLDQVLHALSPTYDEDSYREVLERLHETYHLLFGSASTSTDSDLWPIIFTWLYRLPDQFILALQHREPASLVIFAFFILLFKELNSTWFMTGWPEHIVQGIFASLDPSHRHYIQWPMEVLQCAS
ncbi:hypothetical protein BJY01DRAFT_263946 [Aspergillus pseudoustus]|uniref:Zn(2)-C6 fungal-type domain-containing protein n=1 Tax=Aspergillus pseudoustus TaxID=1810923 RepID=A0ABR4JZV5_9EURO